MIDNILSVIILGCLWGGGMYSILRWAYALFMIAFVDSDREVKPYSMKMVFKTISVWFLLGIITELFFRYFGAFQ